MATLCVYLLHCVYKLSVANVINSIYSTMVGDAVLLGGTEGGSVNSHRPTLDCSYFMPRERVTFSHEYIKSRI